jgi:hypothetical protein
MTALTRLAFLMMEWQPKNTISKRQKKKKISGWNTSEQTPKKSQVMKRSWPRRWEKLWELWNETHGGGERNYESDETKLREEVKENIRAMKRNWPRRWKKISELWNEVLLVWSWPYYWYGVDIIRGYHISELQLNQIFPSELNPKLIKITSSEWWWWWWFS